MVSTHFYLSVLSPPSPSTAFQHKGPGAYSTEACPDQTTQQEVISLLRIAKTLCQVVIISFSYFFPCFSLNFLEIFPLPLYSLVCFPEGFILDFKAIPDRLVLIGFNEISLANCT